VYGDPIWTSKSHCSGPIGSHKSEQRLATSRDEDSHDECGGKSRGK
jgi:hypothetical protein